MPNVTYRPDARARAQTRLPEFGWPGEQVLTLGGIPSQAFQEVPDLAWPQSIVVYDRMLRDPMVRSVERALRGPILRTGWHLGVDGIAPDVADFIGAQLGLDDPETGRARPASAGRGVVWRQFLGDLLLAMRYGHMVHEAVYGIDVDGRICLTKLAPRHPRSIDFWYIDTDGTPLGITQNVPTFTGPKLPAPTQIGGTPGWVKWELHTIDAERLVIHSFDADAGDILGRSMFHAMWRPWFAKDQMQRFQLIAADRHSSLIPIVHHDGSDPEKALALARGLRSGEDSGAEVPLDWVVEMLGSDPVMDLLPWVRFFNEEIAGAAMAMMLTLGHDSGARSLGDTFVSLFTQSLDQVVSGVEHTVTEQVIRRLVELNWGPDEPYPVLVGDTIQSDSAAVVASIKSLVDAGIVTPDQGLEDQTRRRLRMPPADQMRTAAEREQATKPSPPPGAASGDVKSRALALAERIAAGT